MYVFGTNMQDLKSFFFFLFFWGGGGLRDRENTGEDLHWVMEQSWGNEDCIPGDILGDVEGHFETHKASDHIFLISYWENFPNGEPAFLRRR